MTGLSAEPAVSAPAAGRGGRETGIELLRILAMLGIMASHFACYGAGGGGAGAGGLWLALLQAGGKLGVDIFVLISGYFLIKAPAVRTEKALRLWAAMFFYSLGLYLLGVGCGLVPFGRMALLEHLMPLCTSRWWFASCYLLLYLLSPFLNRLLGALRREEYLRLLGLGLVFWCLLPCLTGYAIDKGQVGWFVLLYALAGFLRLHCDLSRLRAGRCLGWAAGFVLLAFALYRGFGVLSARWGFLARYSAIAYELTSLPLLLAAVCFLLGFARLSFPRARGILPLARTTFGVYLLHEHDAMRGLLWGRLFSGEALSGSWRVIPWSVFAVCAVFAGCALIEFCRTHLLERWYLAPLGRLAGRLDRALARLTGWVERRLP